MPIKGMSAQVGGKPQRQETNQKLSGKMVWNQVINRFLPPCNDKRKSSTGYLYTCSGKVAVYNPSGRKSTGPPDSSRKPCEKFKHRKPSETHLPSPKSTLIIPQIATGSNSAAFLSSRPSLVLHLTATQTSKKQPGKAGVSTKSQQAMQRRSVEK